MRRLYTWVLRILFPWVALRLLWRGFANRDYWKRIPERFGFVALRAAEPTIWIHAVSVGEARACAPLVRRLSESHPRRRLLITTMTPTGSATVRSMFGERVDHCYVPYDYPSAVRRFLDRVRPSLAIVMETELWPNLFHDCRARQIPLVVANVRLSERSARRYARFASLVRQTLAQVYRFGVQNAADADRLVALGADPARVVVTGSIKFEIGLPGSLFESADVLRREWGGPQRPVWIAASTHDGEDEAVLAAHTQLRSRPTLANALLVLVPRHPERFAAVTRLCRRQGFSTEQRSETCDSSLAADTTVLVGDTLGELLRFFAASDVAFIGGSLVPTGGHNVLEASAVGRAVVFGPHMFNFREIAAMTLERGAGVQIHEAGELARAMATLLEDPNRRDSVGEAGRRMVEENRGALEKTCALLPVSPSPGRA